MNGDRCPACGRPDCLPWRAATASDAALAARPAYELVRCRSCGTAAVAGAADEPAALYRSGTYGGTGAFADRLLSLPRRAFLAERRRALRGVDAGARVFEVGAGDGSFLALLAREGFRVGGADPAAADGRVEPVAVEDLELDPGSRDAVVFWHSLEHVADPERALRRAHGALVPGGRLVVGVPNLGGLQARLGGDRWFHQDVPRHRVHFTETGLRLLVERTGFRTTRVTHFVAEQGPFGMWQTLLNRLTVDRDVAFRLVKRAAERPRGRDIAVSLAGLPLLPAAMVLELAAARAGRGGAMTFEAVRLP